MTHRIGVYQRPAPPKRPLGLHRPGAVQQPQIPLHQVEAQANAMMVSDGVRNLFCGGKRKRGRPAINDVPMTPAERQAKRRELQARERGIREALAIGDAHGKCHAEAGTGGYDSTKLDLIEGIRQMEYREYLDDDANIVAESHVGRLVRPDGASRDDERSTGELLNSGECSLHRGGFDESEAEGVNVKGLRYATEETNRRLFAEEQLKAMVEAHFDCVVAPAAPGITRYSGNTPMKHSGHVEMTFTCRQCGDSMGSIEDAKDHLRVDHRQAIDEWFKRLNPPRYFRDRGRYVTVNEPVRRKRSLDSAGCERLKVTQPGKMQVPRV